jgi:hypothetical protein
MPNLNLPDYFVAFLEQQQLLQSTRRRKRDVTVMKIPVLKRVRRSLVETTIPGPNNSYYAIVVLGLLFDGYTGYANATSAALPAVTFSAVNVNAFDSGPSSVSLHTGVGNSPVSIKGTKLTSLGSAADYVVNVGLGTCTVLQLEDNALICQPPSCAPAAELNVSQCAPNLRMQITFAGTNKFFYSCAQYSEPLNVPLVAGVTTALAFLFLLVIALIIALCCVAYRMRRLRTAYETDKADWHERVSYTHLGSMGKTDAQHSAYEDTRYETMIDDARYARSLPSTGRASEQYVFE